jgi:hypothetical protein
MAGLTCENCGAATSVVASRSTPHQESPAKLRAAARVWGGDAEHWQCRRRVCQARCGAAPVWTVEFTVPTLLGLLEDARVSRTMSDCLEGA